MWVCAAAILVPVDRVVRHLKQSYLRTLGVCVWAYIRVYIQTKGHYERVWQSVVHKVHLVQNGTVMLKDKQQLLLTGQDVAVALGISRSLAYQWMATGVLPIVKVQGSRSVRVSKVDLLKWITSNTYRARAPSA